MLSALHKKYGMLSALHKKRGRMMSNDKITRRDLRVLTTVLMKSIFANQFAFRTLRGIALAAAFFTMPSPVQAQISGDVAFEDCTPEMGIVRITAKRRHWTRKARNYAAPR
jgi:hypothetical protein